MPDTGTSTPLVVALEQACSFARAHGLEGITPDDFGLQRSESGWQHATYVDAGHAVSVTIEPGGNAILRLAELWWIHDQGDEDRDPCEWCEDDNQPQFRGVPLVDVYLPGDAPAEALHWLPARYHDHCVDCNGPIRPDDDIALTEDGYVCVCRRRGA